MRNWIVLAAFVMAGPAVGQVVPERLAPGATVPPGAGGDGAATTPRSESPLAPLTGSRPVPDAGVLAPPGDGSPVIRPPATGTMPVIPPPGSPGGDPTVVPK